MGENPHLARAAAYYHDVGKLQNPPYFVENQGSYNPHDDLLPEVSVGLITAHTTYGAELCRKYNIPGAIAEIARQHHGNTIVNYFYMKANKITGSELPYDNFRYSGPRPTSKIAAIIMIADSVEAASRVTMPNTPEKLEEYVDSFIKDKMEWRQFDDCPITMRELDIIKRSIAEILPGIRHGRISYKK
jgi:putative nucleotidyltransferase with HDIG domain